MADAGSGAVLVAEVRDRHHSPKTADHMAETARGLMAGKRGLVMGVANHRSIAWGVARMLRRHGAEIAYSYLDQPIKERLLALLPPGDMPLVVECNVGNERSMEAMFRQLETAWGSLDFLVHAIAYAPQQELHGRFIDTTAEGFRQCMEISCYSLAALCRRAEPLLTPNASILAMTYFGSQRVFPHYNVMGVAKAALEASVRYLSVDLGARGVRINAVSSGPIKTLSAAGVGEFRQALKWCAANAPLRRNVTTDDVGGASLFLLSDLARGITGEIVYVDNGYSVMGMNMLGSSEPASSGAAEGAIADVRCHPGLA